MLTEYDIDCIKDSITKNGKSEIYYVANVLELKEKYFDYNNKSYSKFSIIKLEVTDVNNAYMEYLNFKNIPNLYTDRKEVTYEINNFTREYYYKENKSNNKMPHIIYGTKSNVFKNGSPMLSTPTVIPSIISPKYTNVIKYIDDELNNNNGLEWKYKKLANKEKVDGIEYKYVYSDYYILKVSDCFGEYPLINVNDYSSYFTNIDEAYDYLNQLMC